VQLQALLTDVEVTDVVGDPSIDVGWVTHDSRRVRPGALFACLPGQRTDGHEHAVAALDAGAVAFLVERRLHLVEGGHRVTEVLVPSTRAAIGPVAARFHDRPSTSLSCVGITGTNGKTTTTYLLEAIGTAAGRRVGIIGTTGAHIDGTPVALEHTTPEATDLQALLARMREARVALVAMEVSSHALAQRRVDGTRFAVACFTNLSHEHLDYHGDLEEYFEAKARLFTPAFTANAAVNVDDPYGRRLRDRAIADGLDVVSYGLDTRRADVVATDIVVEPGGTRFTLRDERAGTTAQTHIGLLGRHNVANALAAAASARAADLPFDVVVGAMSDVATVPGRLEPVDRGQPFMVLVDYAHSPDALTRALEAARELASGRRVILVFGCGGDRDRAKRPVMGEIAARGADVAIVTSDNPRSEGPSDIVDEVIAAVRDSSVVRIEVDRRAAIEAAIGEARPGDVVLIAGKGHETGQTAEGVTIAFDDRVVAAETLEARA
jgi:UDP-N-acetylmuramoyl-L-alanyl-D-glutamate--2,6-diaminopimelate ligase